MMNKGFEFGDKLLSEWIEVGMIIDIIPKNIEIFSYKDVEVTKVNYKERFFEFCHNNTLIKYNIYIDDKYDFILKGWIAVIPPTINTKQQAPLDEQSIAEAIKTLSRASQELSTHVTVDGKGSVTIYSDYHEEELVFDTAEKLVQYIECVKQMNSFVKE